VVVGQHLDLLFLVDDDDDDDDDDSVVVTVIAAAKAFVSACKTRWNSYHGRY
jgi:hypothetical protein